MKKCIMLFCCLLVALAGCAAFPLGDPAVDFAQVSTKEQAQQMEKQGSLVKVYLYPIPLGGKKLDVNAVYLPKKAASEKEAVDANVIEMAERGEITQYEVKPEYKNDSLVPSRIVIDVSGQAQYNYVVSIW